MEATVRLRGVHSFELAHARRTVPSWVAWDSIGVLEELLAGRPPTPSTIVLEFTNECVAWDDPSELAAPPVLVYDWTDEEILLEQGDLRSSEPLPLPDYESADDESVDSAGYDISDAGTAWSEGGD